MRVLVTGDRGFVGTHFRRRLLADGHEVTGCDLRTGEDCRNLFKRNKIVYDLVVHLAAIVGGRKTIEGHPLTVADDLSIDAEFFQWALRTGQRRLVYYSSSAAYPVSLQDGSTEYRLHEDDLNLFDVRSPDLTYGWAKLTGEYLAQFAELAGVRTHVFRPFSGYGELQSLDYPFPSFVARARKRANPFQVWGTGEQVRDFIHIDDVVSATLRAVELDVPGPVNLGTGRPTNFNELAQICMHEAGYSGALEHQTGEPTGVSYRVADTTKLSAFYAPQIELEEGVRRALRA